MLENELRLPDIIYPNKEYFEKNWKAMVKEGKEKFHVLADFDRTLTVGHVNGQDSPSVIAQIRNGRHLSPDYAGRAFALYNKYAESEHDPKLNHAERAAKMQEWWEAHHQLLIECGLDKASMDMIVAQRTLKMRPGALELIGSLYQNGVPLVIISAAPAYMIAKYLEQDGRLYDNVHIIANWYEFDESGKMIGVKKPVVHSLNKREILVKDFPVFEQIKNRTNVLLLGDNAEDVGMVDGFPYSHLLKIGFLNDHPERLEHHKQVFDAIITHDKGIEFVNELVNFFSLKINYY